MASQLTVFPHGYAAGNPGGGRLLAPFRDPDTPVLVIYLKTEHFS